MKTFTFSSFKGGTAKTSTVLHLGACLAKFHKKKCLLIDFDPQANLSTGLGIGPDTLDTMVPVLKGECKIEKVIKESCVKNLFLIPSNAFLDGIDRSNELMGNPYAHELLRKHLATLEGQFDFCFIDTSPSLGWLTQVAFFASQLSIICAIPEAFSILALRRLREFLAQVNDHHLVDVFGVVLSFWDDRGAINQSFLKEIQASFPNKLFDTKIRRDVTVSRAVLSGLPVMEVNASSRAAVDYKQLTKEFMRRFESLKSSADKSKKAPALRTLLATRS